MQTILTFIENKKQELSNHSFCRWLETAPLSQDALAFAPSMSYFVLGFRDILELVKYANPQTDLEKAINHHCEEDSEHWKWFLQDLSALGYLNSSTEVFLSKIWSDEGRTPRNMVYFLTHLIQQQKDPYLVWTVIECLEAAFAVFIDKLRPQLVQRGLYRRLMYFGKMHDEGEQSHALGSWIEDGDIKEDHFDHHQHELNLAFSEEQIKQAQPIIEKIFMQFEVLFTHWHQEAETTKTMNVLPLLSGVPDSGKGLVDSRLDT